MVINDDLVDEDYMMKKFDRLNNEKRAREESDWETFVMDELVTYMDPVVRVPLKKVVPEEWKFKK